MPVNKLGVYDTGTIATAYFAAAVSRGLRVTLTGGSDAQGAPSAAVADETVAGEGVADVDVAAATYGPVRLFNNGSFPCVAGGDIATSDLLYAAPAGKVKKAATATTGLAGAIGKPLRAAAADGDLINGTPKLV